MKTEDRGPKTEVRCQTSGVSRAAESTPHPDGGFPHPALRATLSHLMGEGGVGLSPVEADKAWLQSQLLKPVVHFLEMKFQRAGLIKFGLSTTDSTATI